MLMGRDAIAALLPHAGTMCLLDGLLDWDEAGIRCVSRRYCGVENPLRRGDGILGIAAGIELAGQAMALHGRLAAGAGGPRRGFLTSVRDVRFFAARLDAAGGELVVAAVRLAGDGTGASYRFGLSRDGISLLAGRATVMMAVTA